MHPTTTGKRLSERCRSVAAFTARGHEAGTTGMSDDVLREPLIGARSQRRCSTREIGRWPVRRSTGDEGRRLVRAASGESRQLGPAPRGRDDERPGPRPTADRSAASTSPSAARSPRERSGLRRAISGGAVLGGFNALPLAAAVGPRSAASRMPTVAGTRRSLPHPPQLTSGREDRVVHLSSTSPGNERFRTATEGHRHRDKPAC